jgi:putative membrane protein
MRAIAGCVTWAPAGPGLGPEALLGSALQRPRVMLKGTLAGAIGGLAGTWAMSEAQRAWTCAVDGEVPESAAGRHDARDWQERSEGQNSNEIAAQVVATRLIGRRLDRGELGVAAALMHYTFGATVGALYGAYAGRRIHNGTGIGIGLTVWLLADEIAMPLLGLSNSTLRRPLEKRLQSIAAHIVFGMTIELTRGAVERQLEQPSSRAA